MKEKNIMRNVLVATTGMSPAVLSETVWALAHPQDDMEPIIPDEVMVITTVTGKQRVQEKLLDSGVWNELCASLTADQTKLIFHEDNIRVVHDNTGYPLDGLATPDNHTAFADRIMHELWGYTSQQETRVIASLAGGFKTMSALMLSCMQWLARPGDRITHVLVDQGLDAPARNFFFPHTQEEEKAIHLIDIPIIPLRQLFQEHFNRAPLTYAQLINSSAEAIRQIDGNIVSVCLSSPKKYPLFVTVNGLEPLRLTPARYAYLYMFMKARIQHESIDEPIEYAQVTFKDLNGLNDWFHTIYANAKPNGMGRSSYDRSTFDKRMSDLRKLLRSTKIPQYDRLASLLPHDGSLQLELPAEVLVIEE